MTTIQHHFLSCREVSGRRHAGENLDQLLEGRAEELGPPIQMAERALDSGGSCSRLLRLWPETGIPGAEAFLQILV
jgi:hypothetical protein